MDAAKSQPLSSPATSRWQRIALEEAPDEVGGVEGGCACASANDEMAGPHVAHTTDGIVNDRHIIAAANPFFSRNVGLLEEDNRVAVTAVMLRPLLQPLRYRWIAFCRRTIIGNGFIGGSVEFHEGNRAGGVATTWYRRVRTGDGGKRGETVGELAGQYICHPTAIRETGRVNALWIDAPGLLQVGQQITDKEDIIGVRIAVGASIPTRVMVWSASALWIGHDNVIGIGKVGEACAVLLLQGRTAMSMKIEHERLLDRIFVSRWNVE